MEEDAPKGRQGRVMWLFAGISEEMLIPSILAKVEGGTKGMEDHGSWETLLVVHPILGVGVLLREVIGVPSIQL